MLIYFISGLQGVSCSKQMNCSLTVSNTGKLKTHALRKLKKERVLQC